jgi:hypothetical protein
MSEIAINKQQLRNSNKNDLRGNLIRKFKIHPSPQEGKVDMSKKNFTPEALKFLSFPGNCASLHSG